MLRVSSEVAINADKRGGSKSLIQCSPNTRLSALFVGSESEHKSATHFTAAMLNFRQKQWYNDAILVTG